MCVRCRLLAKRQHGALESGGPGPLVESLQRPQSDPRKIPDQATDLRFSAYNSTLLGSGNSESQDTRLGGS